MSTFFYPDSDLIFDIILLPSERKNSGVVFPLFYCDSSVTLGMTFLLVGIFIQLLLVYIKHSYIFVSLYYITILSISD